MKLSLPATLVLLALKCPITDVINHTDSWTAFDQNTLLKASERCTELYKDAPCLKTFIKVDELVYRAICGI